MPHDTDPKRQSILAAALVQFGRYGFRRTSMEDIAKETGVSRASLYSHFDNKEEIFRDLSISLHEEALGDAEGALKEGALKEGALKEGGRGNLERRVEAALLAKLGRLMEIVTESPHGGEIMDENSRLCGDVVASSSSRFHKMLAAALRTADQEREIDLKATGLTANSAAELIRLSAAGLKQGAADAAVYRGRLRKFVRVFFAGLSRETS